MAAVRPHQRNIRFYFHPSWFLLFFPIPRKFVFASVGIFFFFLLNRSTTCHQLARRRQSKTEKKSVSSVKPCRISNGQSINNSPRTTVTRQKKEKKRDDTCNSRAIFVPDALQSKNSPWIKSPHSRIQAMANQEIINGIKSKHCVICFMSYSGFDSSGKLPERLLDII